MSDTVTAAAPAEAAALLAELHRLGVCVRVRNDCLSLWPASRIPPRLLAALRAGKADVMALLAQPGLRWRRQAEAMLAAVADSSRRADLLALFDEREAIAAVDGGLDEDAAGRLAYEQIAEELGHDPIVGLHHSAVAQAQR